MKHETLHLLECRGCGARYRAVAHRATGERIEFGYLTCDCRAAVIPIAAGFVLFTEPLLHAGQAELGSLEALAARLFGDRAGFERLYREKRQRGVFESYAAFQPFNESSRAVEPLLPALTRHLREGDCVLDVWCRTGWSGEWLAGELPRQHVIALWEGDSSVLGYRGYRHLLGHGERASNLDVIFANADHGLPFRDEAFALLHGHDVLHRKHLHTFGSEALRVTRRSGALVFPHVHLSNSEPEPFFERGGTIRHGRDYRAWLDAITAGGGRLGLVCSEKTLFARSCEPLADEYDTTHYNALIAILPATAIDAHSPAAGEESRDRFIVNPMFRVDLARRTAAFDPRSLGGGCEELMLRHPAYRERIPHAPLALDGSRLPALILAAGGLTRQDIAAALGGTSEAQASLAAMSDAELLRPARSSDAAHRLQRFHSNQLAALDESVWQPWLRRWHEHDVPVTVAPDGASVSAGEAAELMARMGALLPALGLAAGDWICAMPAGEPLLWLAALGAAMWGVNVDLAARGCLDGGAYGLRLYDGAAPAEHGASPGLSFGIDSLLARLADLDPPARNPPESSRDHGRGGVVRVLADGVCLTPCLGDLVRGCLTLETQDAPRLWAIEGSDLFADLVRVCAAVGRGDRISKR